MSHGYQVVIEYGECGLACMMPDDADITVITPNHQNALPNITSALSEAMSNPIGTPSLDSCVKSTDTVGIVFSDNTRPAPNRVLLPAILEKIKHVPDSQIILFNATGTHRKNTQEELRYVLGESIANRFRVEQNDAADETSHELAGATASGNKIWLHRVFLSCDFRILTGFIEPHFFAGFSGGGKAVMPGLSSLETIMRNHGVRNIDDPNSTWGVTHGNPIWEEIQEAALLAHPDFLLNVSLNRGKAITGIFAGAMSEAHAVGCEFVRESAMISVPEPFDIVLTSNSGYPLDRNLYQAVKGMSAASRIVKKGGAIVIAAECRDGVPKGSPFDGLLSIAGSPERMMEISADRGFHFSEVWQARILASIASNAQIHLYSERLTDEEIRHAWLTPCRSIENTLLKLRDKYGQKSRICVLPEGPVIAPYVV